MVIDCHVHYKTQLSEFIERGKNPPIVVDVCVLLHYLGEKVKSCISDLETTCDYGERKHFFHNAPNSNNVDEKLIYKDCARLVYSKLDSALGN